MNNKPDRQRQESREQNPNQEQTNIRKINLPGMNKYENQLGLNWEISYLILPDAPMVPDVSICMVVSDKNQQTNNIYIPNKAIRRSRQERRGRRRRRQESGPPLDPSYLPDVLHELCHAKLCEDIDQNFGTLEFTQELGALEGQEAREFEDRMQMLFLATRHQDIWVDDLRHEHWPAMTQKEKERFLLNTNTIVSGGGAVLIEQEPTLFLGLCVQMAEDKRHGLEEADYSPVLQELSEDAAYGAIVISDYLANLPRLKFDREEDLKMFEQSVKDMVRMLNLPIDPKLVEEEGRGYVWDV